MPKAKTPKKRSPAIQAALNAGATEISKEQYAKEKGETTLHIGLRKAAEKFTTK